ncbi:MAG: thiamine biosynthesis protein ApbE, partial [Variovorax paradoxus]
MGTTWSLRVDNPRMLPLDALRHAVQSALDEVVAQMSHWDPDSALGRFNRAPAGSTHTLPEAFNDVLARALHWAEASGGALDPGMGPLVALWGFGPNAVDDDRLPPDAAALAAAHARCGWQRIAHDAAVRTLVQPGGLSLDLSGIAK